MAQLPTFFSLEAAKTHLRVTSTREDQGIALMAVAAEGRIEAFLGRPLLGEGSWVTIDEVPAMVLHSIKLALSDFYLNREAPQLTDDQLRPMIGQYQRVSIA